MDGVFRLTSASLAVVATAALAAWFVASSRIVSEWNWAWIVGFPIAATAIFFRRSLPWVWLVVFAWLAICSFVAFMTTAAELGLGS